MTTPKNMKNAVFNARNWGDSGCTPDFLYAISPERVAILGQIAAKPSGR
jgi:hypothetical protein